MDGNEIVQDFGGSVRIIPLVEGRSITGVRIKKTILTSSDDKARQQ